MKKIILILMAFLILCPKSYASDAAISASVNENNLALLTKQGFFEHPQQRSYSNPCDEVKKVLYSHLNYANSYNMEGLKSLYASNFINADGLNKDIYFELIQKTWESYPDIKYKMDIKNIQIDENIAVVQVNERAEAATNSKSGLINEKGLLQSVSDSVYYLEKFNNEWQITSDHIVFEKTFLRYGSAKEINISLTAPAQIPANTQYTSTFKMDVPKDSLIIASIGQENITYPQTVAEEVFRRMPDNGTLERVFKSNDKNINEYAVASFGITKAEVKGTEIKIYITGIGFVMSRINVIPNNAFIKVAQDEKSK